MLSNGLVGDDKVDVTNIISYQHPSLHNSSYIDFIVIPGTFSVNVLRYETIDFALNLSDHIPIFLRLQLDSNDLTLSPNIAINTGLNAPVSNSNKSKRLRWDHANTSFYYDKTYELLQPLMIFFDSHYIDIVTPIRYCCRNVAQDYNDAVHTVRQSITLSSIGTTTVLIL